MVKFFFSVGLFILIGLLGRCDAKTITYMGLGEKRDAYQTELLQAVFSHVPDKRYQIKRYNLPLPHHRAFHFLANNHEIDIVVAYATDEREEKYRAIPIPLLKGLNGWRVSAVHTDNKNMFKGVKTLEAFKTFVPGQFHSWTDFKILKANGIKLSQGSDFNGLYYMLDAKRFEYFPRSILEIDQEVGVFSTGEHQLNIMVEPHMMIIYPAAFYFYVNKENKALADNIQLGLEAIIANGEFDDIFKRHYGKFIARIKSEKRHVFYLENPLLPKSVPVDRKELWQAY